MSARIHFVVAIATALLQTGILQCISIVRAMTRVHCISYVCKTYNLDIIYTVRSSNHSFQRVLAFSKDATAYPDNAIGN